MRVARVIAKLEPGGAQLSVLRLVRELALRGVASDVLAGTATPAGLELFDREGIGVTCFGAGEDLQERADPAFARWLAPRLAGADVVHAHMLGAWWACARAVAPGTPLVASEHNRLRATPHRAMDEALPRIDAFFAHGPQVRDQLLAAGLLATRLLRGLSAVPVAPVSQRPGLAPGRVVFAGRLHPEKGPDLLVEALARMGDAPPAVILGSGTLTVALKRAVRLNGQATRVRFAGWQHDPAPWIAGAGALVVPSREEAVSQAAILAMGLGVPVVATAVGGLRETLAGDRGHLVAPEDPDALAAGIEAVLSGSVRPDLDEARRFAAGFAPASVADAYEAVYRRLTAPDRARPVATA